MRCLVTVCGVTLLAVEPVIAGRVLYLARDERLCDGAEIACVVGTLRYDVNMRMLWLHGRLATSPGPGTFAITVKGATRLGYVRYAPVEVSLRGTASEIVNFRMIPDDPDVYAWQIDRIEWVSEPRE